MQIDIYKLPSGGFTFIIVCVVIFILVTSFAVSFIYRPDEFQKTRLNVFFTTLASIAIVFVGMNIIMTAFALENSQKFTRISKTKEIVDKLWLYPNQLITQSMHARPIFLASFYMNNQQLYKITAAKAAPGETTRMILEEQFIALVIIQTWEDALTMHEYDDTGMQSWISAFLVWAQNPYLKDYFKILHYSYKQSTIEFGELLFEYASTLPRHSLTDAVYNETTQHLIEDPRFIKLLNATK